MINKFIISFCFVLYSLVSQAAIEAYPTITDKFGSKIIFESPISEEDTIKVFQINNAGKKLIFEVPFYPKNLSSPSFLNDIVTQLWYEKYLITVFT